MKHMNVTRVMPLETVKMYIQVFGIKYDFTEMKLAKEYFQIYTTGITLEHGSPFKGVDRTLTKLTDSGLIYKWTVL